MGFRCAQPILPLNPRLLRRDHLLGAPLADQSAQRRRFDRLVEYRDRLLTRSGPHMRTAVRRDQDRRNVFPKTAANVADRSYAVSAIEMIVDQKPSDPSARSLDRLDRGLRVAHRDDLGIPGGE